MAHINLLPWRDWERERKKKEFLTNLVAVLLVGGVLVLLGGLYLDGKIENQENRNKFLQTKITILDTKIAEISMLKKDKQELLARMDVIQALQGNRPVIVRVFDEMARTLSKGVHFRKLELSGGSFKVEGTAESNNRISALMRNIDESDWFSSPNLRSIKEDEDNTEYGAQASTFDLTFVQTKPSDSTDAGED